MQEGKRIYYAYSDFDPNAEICMYMPLSFFQKNLENGSLFFKKKKEFVDYQEASFSMKQFLNVITAVGENIPSQKISHEELKCRMELFHQYKEHGDLLTSCWTLRRDENYLMWDSYARKKGVRIKTTIDKFVCSLKTNDYEVLCGQVKYQNYDLNKSLERNLYTKDKYYCNEEEFRFYLFPTNKETEKKIKECKGLGLDIPIDWKVLAPDVVISPFFLKKCALCIQQDLKQSYGFLHSVECSRIDINPKNRCI